MIEILTTIALVCQVGGMTGIDAAERTQLKCQQQLIQCVNKTVTTSISEYATLKACMLERKPTND